MVEVWSVVSRFRIYVVLRNPKDPLYGPAWRTVLCCSSWSQLVMIVVLIEMTTAGEGEGEGGRSRVGEGRPPRQTAADGAKPDPARRTLSIMFTGLPRTPCKVRWLVCVGSTAYYYVHWPLIDDLLGDKLVNSGPRHVHWLTATSSLLTLQVN